MWCRVQIDSSERGVGLDPHAFPEWGDHTRASIWVLQGERVAVPSGTGMEVSVDHKATFRSTPPPSRLSLIISSVSAHFRLLSLRDWTFEPRRSSCLSIDPDSTS